MPIITSEAQVLLDRLDRLDLEDPRADRPAIEAALSAHLAGLGLPERRIVWAEDGPAWYALTEGRTADPALVAARTSAKDVAEWLFARAEAIAEVLPIWRVSVGLLAVTSVLTLTVGDRFFFLFGLVVVLIAIAKERRNFRYDRGGIGVAGTDGLTRRAAWTKPSVRLLQDVCRMGCRQPGPGDLTAPEEAVCAIEQINYLTARSHPEAPGLVALWHPIVDAFEAGLLLYRFCPDEIICLLQPRLKFSAGRIHCDAGPAVLWPSGEGYYVLNGSRVMPTQVRPVGPITIEAIREEPLACVRYTLLQKFRSASPSANELHEAVLAMQEGVGKQASHLLERLRALDPLCPRRDETAIERAMTAYLDALGIEPKSFLHVADPWSGRGMLGDYPVWDKRWESLADTYSWYVDTASPAWKVALNEAVDSGISAAEAVPYVAALGRVCNRGSVYYRPFGTMEDAMEDAVCLVGMTNGLRAGCVPEMATAIGASMPLFDAIEAGLGWFWVLEDRAVCIPRPSMHIENGSLHCASGPAVRWPSGATKYFWRGVEVSHWIIESPERITVRAIREESNQEIRRSMVEIYGRGRYLKESNARLVHEDAYGRLWEADAGRGEHWRFVEVENGTPEPDGTYRSYTLDVTDAARLLGRPIETAHAAVAATYGLAAEEYRPEIRT